MSGLLDATSALAGATAAAWLAWMQAALWRGTVALVAVAVVDLILRRRLWPQVLAALWSVAFLQHLLPPGLVSPLGLLPASGGGVGAVSRAGSAAMGGAPAVVPPGSTGLTEGSGGLGLVLLAWLAGVLLFAAAGRCRRRRALLRLRSGRVATPARLERILRRARKRFDSGRQGLLRWLPAPRLLVSRTAGAPAVLGVWRPEIVLPAPLPARLDDRDLEHVLVHELAHVRRGDLVLQGLLAGLHLLFWFQPLMIWARRRAHACRELCCDATATSVLAGDAGAYRTTLLRLALEYGGQRTPEVASLFAGVIVHRVERLASDRRAPRTARLVAAGLLLVVPALSLPAPPAHPIPAASGNEPLAVARRQVEAALEEGSSMRLRHAVMRLHDLEREGSGRPAGVDTPKEPDE